MNKFDENQKKAIEIINGPVLCVAGPGSGKTTVIVNRTLNIVKHGIDPNKILVVTFTKAAAEEMGKRYLALEGAIVGPKFLTIHSLAYNIVRTFYHYTFQNIMNEWEQKKIIKQWIADHGSSIQGASIKKVFSNIASDISRYKMTDNKESFTPANFKNKNDFIDLFDGYVQYQKENNKIDYDDMILLCHELLKDDQKANMFRNLFSHIMVDEFQDTDQKQADIIYTIAHPLDNIFICGDDDQSIYGFRYASPKVMLNFTHEFSDVKIIKLSINYRSYQSIITSAAKLISHNQERFDKSISGNSAQCGKIEIREIKAKEKIFDSDIVLSRIKKLQKNGVQNNQIAILCRTNKEVSIWSSTLSNNSIPFIARDIVSDLHVGWVANSLYSYLRIAYKTNDLTDVQNIINKPSRYVNKQFIEQYSDNLKIMESKLKDADKSFAAKNISSLISQIIRIQLYAKEHTVNETAQYIIDTVNFKKYIKDTCEFELSLPEDSEDTLHFLINEMNGFNTLSDYFTYVDDSVKALKEKLETGDGIILSTMHKAKGCEWDHVIIPSCIDGNIPYYHKDDNPDEVAISEERRVFYVAITRAKESVLIITSENAKESRFIKEITKK